MSKKHSLKETFKEKYLLPQDKKWKRIIDSLAAVLCFFSGLTGLYLLQTQSVRKLPVVPDFVIWGYIIASLPLAYLLYRESDLLKIERFVLVLFILLSSMSMLFSVMAAIIKT